MSQVSGRGLGGLWGGNGGVGVYIELFHPPSPACLFHRRGAAVHWWHRGRTVCVFTSGKVKDCFK